MKYLKKLLLVLGTTSSTTSLASEFFPIFEASASASLATHMLQIEINEHQVISKTVKGFDVSGRQHTHGPAQVTFFPNSKSAELHLKFDLESDSKMLATSNLRQGIEVQIDTSAKTRLSTIKPFLFSPEKFTSIHVQCKATTSLTINSIRASARGMTRLGRSIKSNVAIKKVAAAFEKSKPEQEEIISQETAKSACESINRRTDDFMVDLQADFQQIIFDPLFEKNSLENNLRFWSSPNRIFATATTQSSGLSPAIHEYPPESHDRDLSILMHQEMLNQFATLELGGRTFDEIDFQELFRRSGINVEKSEQTLVADELILKFCPQKPVEYVFDSDQILVNVCASSLRLHGKDLGGATLSLNYTLHPTETGALIIARSHDITVNLDEGRNLSESERDAITERYDHLFPWKSEIGPVSLPTRKNPQAGLWVTDAITSAGWLNVKMQLSTAVP